MPPRSRAQQQQEPKGSAHPSRQRQDLSTVQANLRTANDMRAKDNYDLLQLGFVREGKDPNESDTEEMLNYGYESPIADLPTCVKTMHDHVKVTRMFAATASPSSRPCANPPPTKIARLLIR